MSCTQPGQADFSPSNSSLLLMTCRNDASLRVLSITPSDFLLSEPNFATGLTNTQGVKFFTSSPSHALLTSNACCVQILSVTSSTGITSVYSNTALTQRHRQIDITASQTRAVLGTNLDGLLYLSVSTTLVSLLSTTPYAGEATGVTVLSDSYAVITGTQFGIQIYSLAGDTITLL